MRTLALDVGGKRIGLAISDPEGRIALPVGALERRDLEADLAALAEMVRQQGAKRVVVGLPLSMDGSVGPQAREVLAFTEALAQRLEVPLEMWDERLTTVEAERRLRELGRRRRRAARARKDALAAAIILEDYLSGQQARLGGPPGEGAVGPGGIDNTEGAAPCGP